jgi:hypothetical protein
VAALSQLWCLTIREPWIDPAKRCFYRKLVLPGQPPIFDSPSELVTKSAAMAMLRESPLTVHDPIGRIFGQDVCCSM